jgi:D-xylose transport system substrate-binding protein
MYSKSPVVASLWGGQEDANSYLFKGGVDQVSTRCTRRGTLKKGPAAVRAGWDNQKAGTIFEQMLVKTGNKIDAVAAANDGLANAVVVALKVTQAEADPAERPGRDQQGVQNIISGWQTMDGVQGRPEAGDRDRRGRDRDRQGQEAADDGVRDHQGTQQGAGYLIAPQSITKANWTSSSPGGS